MPLYLPPSMALIEAYTFDGATAAKTFSGIPQGFARLIIVGRVRSTRAAQPSGELLVTFNGDTTAANYLNEALLVNNATLAGAGVTADAGFKIHCPAATAPANGVSTPTMRIDAYTDAFLKSAHWEYQNRVGVTAADVTDYYRTGQWLNVAAITSITLTDSFAFPVAGSTFRLYGQI